VAQTFFLDDARDQFSLDAIVTMVDAKHFGQHVDELNRPAEQVAFADLVLLNKTDLVDAAALGASNAASAASTAPRDLPHEERRCADRAHADVGAFDLARRPSTSRSSNPSIFGGAVRTLKAGDYLLKAAGEHDHHAHDMGMSTTITTMTTITRGTRTRTWNWSCCRWPPPRRTHSTAPSSPRCGPSRNRPR
jgi:G3E family GTPase